MSWLATALAELVGLFVTDWRQTLITLGILASGWLAIARTHRSGFAALVAALLTIQLVWATDAEARGRR